MYQVKKRDGSIEPFDRSKITNGLLKAGASNQQAEQVAMEIEKWVSTLKSGVTVEATQIKAKVLEVLSPINQAVATAFGAYKK